MKMNTILRVLNCLSVLVQLSEGFCNSNNDFVPDKFLSGNITRIIQPFGKQMCVNECQRVTDCKSVNYWRLMLECQLNNGTDSSENQLVNGNGWSYVQVEKQPNSFNCTDKQIAIPLSNGEGICVVQRCDSVLVINNREYLVADTSIGAYTNQPCATEVGYISVGCKYVCESSGNWDLAESNGSIKIHTNSKNWYNANTTCSSENARLLIIPDEVYYNTIKAIVSPIVAGRQFFGTCKSVTYQFWIGANDIEVEGSFKWLNGEGFSSWHKSLATTDNISCDKKQPVDCILIVIDSNTISDRNCNAELPFICHKY